MLVVLLTGVVNVLLVRHDFAPVPGATRPVTSDASGAAVAARAVAAAVRTSSAAEYCVHAEVQRRHRRGGS